jgi:Protein of unknown function (DUF2867)
MHLRRRTSAARTATVDVEALDALLPGWDHADAYAVRPAPDDALTAARVLFDVTARGRVVLRLRDLLVRPFGLEPALGTREEVFPVLHRSAERVVLGLDDRHLDFRVLVDVRAGEVRCTTAIRRRPLGRAYFAVVGPFHRRIVPAMLERAARRGWTGRG